jgi:carboxyl-terminal processing protease
MTFKARCFLVCLALLAGCASFDPHNILGRRSAERTANIDVIEFHAGDAASARASREQTVDYVWRTVKERYYRPDMNGVDWDGALLKWRSAIVDAPTDDDYWRRLDQMVGELGDSHTRVEAPAQVEARRKQRVMSLGLGLRDIDGQLVVLSVNPDANAFFAGIRAGMVITRIDGQSAIDLWREWIASSRKSSSDTARRGAALRRLNELAKTKSDGVAVEFARFNGAIERTRLAMREIPTQPVVAHRVLPSGLGYVRLTGFSEWLRPGLLRAIDSLKDTPGIVLDLRGNRGGSAAMADALVGAFFKEKTVIGKAQTRTNRPVTIGFGTVELIALDRFIPGRADAYTGKLAVLIDADSASASEAVASALQSTGRAEVFGETSCGCLLAFLGYAQLNGGADLSYSEVGYVNINNERVENVGVKPNRYIQKTIDDIRSNRDRPLEAAVGAIAGDRAPNSR